MSKGFFSSLSNFVSDTVYTTVRAGFAVGSLGMSEILLAEMGHESPMERRERQEERLELQKEYIRASVPCKKENNK